MRYQDHFPARADVYCRFFRRVHTFTRTLLHFLSLPKDASRLCSTLSLIPTYFSLSRGDRSGCDVLNLSRECVVHHNISLLVRDDPFHRFASFPAVLRHVGVSISQGPVKELICSHFRPNFFVQLTSYFSTRLLPSKTYLENISLQPPLFTQYLYLANGRRLYRISH